MKIRKITAAVAAAAVFSALLPAYAEPSEDNGAYVLMNIPYSAFYKAELDADSAEVDAVSSATKNKPRTGTLAGGSYHVDPEGTDISGVIYPVYVEDKSILESFKKVTDDTSVSITVTNRGTPSTSEYIGRDALFESESYSYYELSDTPDHYKTLTSDGEALSFSEVKGDVTSVDGADGSVTVGARHADIEIKLSGTEGIAQGAAVSGVVITTASGEKYGLRHVVNIWRATEIGWNTAEMDLLGETLTNIRYYTQNAVYDYPVSIFVGEKASASYTAQDYDYSEQDNGKASFMTFTVTPGTNAVSSIGVKIDGKSGDRTLDFGGVSAEVVFGVVINKLSSEISTAVAVIDGEEITAEIQE